MLWIAVALVIVGYLLIQFLDRRSQRSAVLKLHDSSLKDSLPATIEDRNEELREKIAQAQDQLLKVLRATTLFEGKRIMSEVNKLATVNARLCVRYSGSQELLYAQQSDWLKLLNLYLERHYPTKDDTFYESSDEAADAAAEDLRGAEMHELYKRIMARMEAKKTLTKTV